MRAREEAMRRETELERQQALRSAEVEGRRSFMTGREQYQEEAENWRLRATEAERENARLWEIIQDLGLKVGPA